MNDEIKVPTMQVPPIKRVCMTIGQLPTSYVETMSYYEMLVWFVNYLRDDIIPVVNANGLATKELQELFVQLQSYVNTYFDNLDVQDEINNKLDEMADSGQLTDIIAQYLGLAGMITFNTVAEMKLAENLVNGSKCCTLGYHNVNDGGGATYKIRTITNDDIVDEKFIIEVYDNSLIAELIYDDSLEVEKIGAYGDGIHDDTLIIQACINKNIKTILNKKYKITSSLTVDIGYNKGIEGTGTLLNTSIEGNQFSTLTLSNSLYPEDISPDAYYDASRFVIKGLTITNINGDNYTDSTHYGNGIQFADGCNRITIENCIVKNLYYGILSRYANVGIYLNSINNCSIYANEYNIWLSATSDAGENITFNECKIFGAKIGNRIEQDMYVNFIACSIDYNHDYIFYIMGGSNVVCTNCHIEWRQPNRAFILNEKCSLKFKGCTIVHRLTDTCDYMIYCNNTYPYVLFDSCSFMSSQTYTNLCNNEAFIEFVNCDRLETEPMAFTGLHNNINLIAGQNLKYPLGFNDTKLTFGAAQCIVTASAQDAHNRLYIPLGYFKNRDGKITVKVDCSENLDFTISIGDTHFLGDGSDGTYGTVNHNETLTASTQTTYEYTFKRRKGQNTELYIMFNLQNLSASAWFRVREINVQVI